MKRRSLPLLPVILLLLLPRSTPALAHGHPCCIDARESKSGRVEIELRINAHNQDASCTVQILMLGSSSNKENSVLLCIDECSRQASAPVVRECLGVVRSGLAVARACVHVLGSMAEYRLLGQTWNRPDN